MKKFLSILIAIAVTASLAGCGQESETEDVPSTGTPVTVLETEPATQALEPTDLESTKPKSSTEPESTEQRATEPTTEAPFAAVSRKTGDILKAETDKKIWAGVVGDAYILLRNISEANEWGETGRVYELHCAQFAGQYSMWSDGYWELSDDGTQLTLTPKNQSKNGSIGVDAGKSKTYTGQNGVFTIDLTFEQGGKATIKLDLNKAL